MEKEKNKCIAKTDEGIIFIINKINKIKDHNESYFKNTFNFLGSTHPPFKESLIYYAINSNSFKFISKLRLCEIEVKTWNDYNCELCLIRAHKFAYLSIQPFDIIVSSADFLLNGDNLDIPAYFDRYIHKLCTEELFIWKKLLVDKGNIVNRLF